MAKKVAVTKAQKAAAEYALARSSKTGQFVPNSVRKIAKAKTPASSKSVVGTSH